MEQQVRQAGVRIDDPSANQRAAHGRGALARHAGTCARAVAAALIAGVIGSIGACGGSDDDTVRMTGSADDAAQKNSSAGPGRAASGDAQTAMNAPNAPDAPNAPIGVDAAQLVSPVSQAPVGRQTVRQAQQPAGHDSNPPRHP